MLISAVGRRWAGFFLLCIARVPDTVTGKGSGSCRLTGWFACGPLGRVFSGCASPHKDQFFSGKVDCPAAYGWAPLRGCCCAVV